MKFLIVLNNEGLSIVASAILKLAKLEAIFVFATHLHQLPEIEEIRSLKYYLSSSICYV